MNLEWFRSAIANRGSDEDTLTFDALNALAEAITPDVEDPIFIPHLGGRACPSQPHLHGGWMGVQWTHSLGHLYRAVLEGVALEYGLYARGLAAQYPALALRELRITGGGEKSRPWNQLKADVLGIPVTQIARGEGAVLGSALLAGLGTGVFSEVTAAAAQWITTGNTCYPQADRYEFYQQRLRRYVALIDAMNVCLGKELV